MISGDVDEYGRVRLTTFMLRERLMEGKDLNDFFARETFVPDAVTGQQKALLAQFNEMCAVWDRPQLRIEPPASPEHSPQEEHRRRQATWLYPDELHEINVREFVLSLCTDDVQRERVNFEMDDYERHELVPVLILMIFLVDHFRTNKIVFGVGRGSSVASYVLYKIGIHKIDSIRFGLNFREFIKE